MSSLTGPRNASSMGGGGLGAPSAIEQAKHAPGDKVV